MAYTHPAIVQVQRITINTLAQSASAASDYSVVLTDEVIVEKIFIAKVIRVNEHNQTTSNDLSNSSITKSSSDDHELLRLRFACTPTDVKELIVGALFNEDIITTGNDVLSLDIRGNIVNVIVKMNNKIKLEPDKSSNIECETSDLESKSKDKTTTRNSNSDSDFTIHDICQHIQPCPHPFTIVSADKLVALMAELHHRQQIFPRTGSAHAAMLVAADGKVLYFAEDVGRHNGIDKVIGKCLLQHNTVPTGCVLILSSRIAFELVHKAAKAGVALIAAVSAPSSLAIAAADYWNITLCGFVRNGKINIYTHPSRVS